MKHQWDRDIGQGRTLLRAVMTADAFLVGINLWRHSWLNAIAGAVFIVNMAVGLHVLRAMQETRDRIRLVSAVQLGLRQELDKQ